MASINCSSNNAALGYILGRCLGAGCMYVFTRKVTPACEAEGEGPLWRCCNAVCRGREKNDYARGTPARPKCDLLQCTGALQFRQGWEATATAPGVGRV